MLDYYGEETRAERTGRLIMELADKFLEAMDVRDNPDCFYLQVACLREEVNEALEAYNAWMEPEEQPEVSIFENLLKEIGDCYFIFGSLSALNEDGFGDLDAYEEVDRLAAVLDAGGVTEVLDHYEDSSGYFALLDIVEEVTRSNLSKLDDNGKPIRREDGKVLKGPNYSPADMKPIAQKLLRIQ